MPAAHSRASSATVRPTSRASPSSVVETMCASSPAAFASSTIASHARAPFASSTVSIGAPSRSGE